MFSTRKSQNKESDVDKLFKSGAEVSYDSLLKCNDLSTAYRNNNPYLIGFLLQPKNIEELLNLLMRSDERQTHKTIISLFQTNNTILHRFFADSIKLSQYAFRSLEPQNTSNGCYAAGSISRILSRAMDMWAVETHQVFVHSSNLYGIVIRNIEQSCIYYTVQDLINTDTHPIDLFVWCLFCSIAGKEFIETELKGKKPRTCLLCNESYDLPDFHDEWTKNREEPNKSIFNIKFTKSLELLHTFLKKKKSNHKYDDFRLFIQQYVICIFDKEEFVPFHLELAREAGNNDDLRSKVIGKLHNIIKAQATTDDVTEVDNIFIDRCISYLTKFTDNISQDDFLKITTSLLDERFTQFTLLNLVEFVRRFFLKKDRENLKETSEFLDRLIIVSWNVFTAEDEKALENAESASLNKLESECLLVQSIILDLWKAIHAPDIMTQSSKETQYADDFHKNDDEDTSDFMKSQYSSYGGSNNDDDEKKSEEVSNSQKIEDAANEWEKSSEFEQHKNTKFVNDIKIWFNSEYLISVNDLEPYKNELNLTSKFENISMKILDDVNSYRWGKKFPKPEDPSKQVDPVDPVEPADKIKEEENKNLNNEEKNLTEEEQNEENTEEEENNREEVNEV